MLPLFGIFTSTREAVRRVNTSPGLLPGTLLLIYHVWRELKLDAARDRGCGSGGSVSHQVQSRDGVSDVSWADLWHLLRVPPLASWRWLLKALSGGGANCVIS